MLTVGKAAHRLLILVTFANPGEMHSPPMTIAFSGTASESHAPWPASGTAAILVEAGRRFAHKATAIAERKATTMAKRSEHAALRNEVASAAFGDALSIRGDANRSAPKAPSKRTVATWNAS